MDRRDLLKLLSLSTLALAGGTGLLSACAGEQDPGLRPGSPMAQDVELVVADVRRAPGEAAAVPGTVAAMQTTGGALLGELVERDGNLALSPYSVVLALAMTAHGAAGETRAQLESVLGATVEELGPGLNALTAHVEGLSGKRTSNDGTGVEIVLDAANALFGQRGVAWGRAFLETLAREYGAGLQTVDYDADPERARSAVNAWTAEQTRDRIDEILPPGTVDALTRLVLVNTLYLKAPWATPFEVDLTVDGDVTLLDGTTVSTPLMRTGEPITAPTSSGPGWRSVRLPYAGREVAMTVVVPDPGRYPDVEADLVASGPAGYLPTGPDVMVDVTLPSFTFRTQVALTEALQRLGASLPFDEARADFSAMTTEVDLHVGAVLHEVVVAVDEAGTEAAAATAVVVREVSAPLVDEVVVVDRPFLFVVHDVEHGTPLFVGRVLDPRG